MILKHTFLLCSLLSSSALMGWGVETTIKGGRMDLINKGEEVVFLGEVRLDRGQDVVKANEMRTGKNREKVTALGNVRLVRKVSSTETWQGFGDNGFYNTQSGSGYLIGKSKRAQIIRTEILSSTSTRVLNLWATRIDFHKKDQETFAKGNVQGRTVDPETQDVFEFFSEKARFDGVERKLVLTGKERPVVIQVGKDEKKKIRGNTITYFVDSKKMVSEGDAEAVLERIHEEEN